MQTWPQAQDTYRGRQVRYKKRALMLITKVQNPTNKRAGNEKTGNKYAKENTKVIRKTKKLREKNQEHIRTRTQAQETHGKGRLQTTK